MSLAEVANADLLESEYRVNTLAIANNNMRMKLDANDRVMTNIVGVSANISHNSPRQSLKLNASANGTRHSRFSEGHDYVAQSSFGLDFNYIQARSQFSLRGAYQSDNNPFKDPTQVNLTGSNVSRKTWSVMPAITLSMSNVSTATLNGSVSTIRFPNDMGAHYQDYKELSAGVSLTRRWTTRLSTTISSNAGRYAPISSDYSIDNVQLLLSSQLAITETSSAEAAAGVFRKTSRLNVSDDGWLARASINNVSQRGRFTLDVARQLSPTGFGTVSTSDRAGLGIEYAVGMHLSAMLSAQLSRTHANGVNGLGVDSTFGAVTMSFMKQFAPQWRSSLSATAIRQAYFVPSVAANDFQGRLEIEYSGHHLLN